jgi:hypothetical protein
MPIVNHLNNKLQLKFIFFETKGITPGKQAFIKKGNVTYTDNRLASINKLAIGIIKRKTGKIIQLN